MNSVQNTCFHSFFCNAKSQVRCKEWRLNISLGTAIDRSAQTLDHLEILRDHDWFDQENTSKHVRKDNVQCDQASTVRPTASDVGTLDFRVQGLLHSTVEKAEYVRVRELIKRIENHPHRNELQADSMQDKVYNPFSENSKKMIHDLGNVEYFEFCETTSEVQRSYCLST